MEYRGIKFEVVQGSLPDVWKWSAMSGDPQMLRMGEAATEQQAVCISMRLARKVMAQHGGRAEANIGGL